MRTAEPPISSTSSTARRSTAAQPNASAAQSHERMSAREALVETFAYYKYEVTRFEADLWSRIIDEYGDEAVLSFLQVHLRQSQFAPKVSDAQRLLCPGRANEDAAFLSLNAAVRRWGPYGSPHFDDPAIALAVVHLGGWPAVNEQLPSPAAAYDFETYKRRFSAAYQVAVAEQTLHGVSSFRLKGLHALGSPTSVAPESLDSTLLGQHRTVMDRAVLARGGAR